MKITREYFLEQVEEAYTIFHYGFPPVVLLGGAKVVDYLDAIKDTIAIDSIVGRKVVGFVFGDDDDEGWCFAGTIHPQT
jgi:hypothetical protein